MRIRMAVAAALLLAGAVPALAEEDCRLKQVADFTLKKDAGGKYVFPLTIGDQDRWFVLSLNSPFSVILGGFADAQKFETRKLPGKSGMNAFNEKVTQSVTVPGFSIGRMRAGKFDMLRAEGPIDRDPDVIGLAGLDLLAKFDVELDLKNSRMKLFSQDHCSGQVVYWADDYAKVPFESDPSGHFAFDMQLDGKHLSVDFFVAAETATMDMRAAKRIFDLDEKSPRMQKLQADTDDDYRYPFKSLALEGIAIANPAIVLRQREGKECRAYHPLDVYTRSVCYGKADLYLGEPELAQMHLYFAFKEKMLYATPADATLPKSP